MDGQDPAKDVKPGAEQPANQEGKPQTPPQDQPKTQEFMIPKHRFDEVNNRNKALEEEIAQLKSKLNPATPNPEEDWKAKYEALLKENREKEEAAAAARRRETIMNSIGQEAQDKALIYDLLKLDTITVEGDKVEGLSEQIKELKKTKPFLFKPVAQVAKPAASASAPTSSFGKELGKEAAPLTPKSSNYFN